MRIKNTRQLRAIHEVLHGADRPVSIEEIHHAARVREPGLGVATVYRTVKTLVADRTVVSINLPGEVPRFELSGKGHHHHFQCNRCGRVFETKACLGNLRRLIPRRFQLTGHELILYGCCAECRA